MAAKKIVQTPDFVNGLLRSADEIDKLLNPKLHPRTVLYKLGHGEKKLKELSSEELKELGKYQARVVLMVLAVELALKLLWEGQKGKPATPDHNIDQLFGDLSGPLKVQIQSEYCEQAKSPPPGWETPDKIFRLLKDASIKWRYLVEESNFPRYFMQAKYLKYATLSVLKAGETPAEKNEQP